MSAVGQRESRTQKRVIVRLQALGYEYLGHWKNREGNANIEEGFLRAWLRNRDLTDGLAEKALGKIRAAAEFGGARTLYEANREVHDLLRYGVKVRPEVGENHETVWLIDWENPDRNDFAIAEEVTVAGKRNKRPDIVFYVNGIALAVLELKRSTVSVTEGIRQNLDSQKKEFIQHFFSTVQLVLAGNETEGLRYGAVETPEKQWLRWKEAGAVPPARHNPLLEELGQLCNKRRLLELIHDFVVFDSGTKKICRPNQYFGVKASQERTLKREGGILWHTQGSGKSLTMVWLAKWIRENVENSRVLIVTDRKELDEQIKMVFESVNEDIRRTKSGADLVKVLDDGVDELICSLIHKFGASDEGDVGRYQDELEEHLPAGFSPPGTFFVFVDECHRTQSGKLHAAMKKLLPGATLIGFTGTPLLKADKRRSIETFGPYIHTYKYDEAVRDGVVLDLRYEARDIDQRISAPEKVDQWFEAHTRGLTDVAKAQLKQRWGTMQGLRSARDRLEKIVADILMDIETRDRLKSGRGNVLLVSDSIYSACRFFEMFERTPLAGKCAIVTSYRPQTADIKGEDAGEGQNERLLKYDVFRRMLATHFDQPEDQAMHRIEEFEKQVKKRFVKAPGQMKLLIVVDKLLTGFDAPSATYLYLDKQMRDHGLFQAICRVNRLDGEDKEYGYVVDYKDLFGSLEKAVGDYTGEAFAGYNAEDVQGLLKGRLKLGRERLEEAREAVEALCEGVEPPGDTAAYIRFFCGSGAPGAEQQVERERKRLTLYRLVAAYVRAWANLANETAEAGYTESEAARIRQSANHYENVRQEVKLASGDYVNLKTFEPAMRHLLDAYVRAGESEKISAFDDLGVVQMLVERGEEAIGALPEGIRSSPEAVAETIENNVRRIIVDEMAVNPKYYEKMSTLLDDLVEERRRQALAYREYLERVRDLAGHMLGGGDGVYPPAIDTLPLKALYDNLGGDNDELREAAAIRIDQCVRNAAEADWRGNVMKERKVQIAILEALGDPTDDRAADLLKLVKAQRDY